MNATIVSTILRALLKWWWLIVVAVALSVGAGYYIRSQQPDQYATKASLLVGQDPRTVEGGVFRSSRDLLNAYSVFVRRQFILEPVIEDLNLGISYFEMNEMLFVEVNWEASLLELTIVDFDPNRAAVIANRLAQEVVDQSAAGAVNIGDPGFVNRQIENLQNQIDELQNRYNELIAEAATLTSAFEISQNLNEQETTQRTLQSLQTLYAQYLNSTSDVQRQVRIFEAAIPNLWPIASSGIMDLVLPGVIGGLLAVVTIVLITFMDDRFQWSESDLETVEGERVLGPLGIVPARLMPFYAENAPQSLEAEALRQLRAKIVLAARDGIPPRVITFISHDSGDGKTLTSTNMALTYASSGERTLLIDGDIRKGDIHELFRLPNVYGFSDLLASREPIEHVLPQTLLQTNFANLTLMTGGRSSQDPAALISGPRFRDLVELLRDHFDVVIFDSAPTIAGQDGVFLSSASDGVVIVIHARRTTMSALRRTLTTLREGQNVYVLGLAINRVRLQVTSKYSSHYYRHTPGISSDQLNRELLKPAKSGFSVRSNVLITPEGERLYSLKAASTQLGVRKHTIVEWCKSGVLQAQRRGLRTWIHENEIERMLKGLPVALDAPLYRPEPAGLKKTPTARDLPGALREQRNAVLDFATKPDNNDTPSS